MRTTRSWSSVKDPLWFSGLCGIVVVVFWIIGFLIYPLGSIGEFLGVVAFMYCVLYIWLGSMCIFWSLWNLKQILHDHLFPGALSSH